MMLRVKETLAVPTVLLCGFLVEGRAQPRSQGEAKPDAAAVLGTARETYRHLRSYHFERILLVQEAGGDGRLAKIAEVTLTTATENAEPRADGEMLSSINIDRLRLRTKTDGGERLQLCDGRTCWSYTSKANEYMTGQRLRDVTSSVGGSMVMALHLFTSSAFEDRVAQDVKIVREEEVEVGDGRRSCYVIEAQIHPILPSMKESKPPNPATLGVSWAVSMLRLQGLAEQGPVPSYWPWPDESPTGAGQPTALTLWIDKRDWIVVRSKMAAELYKLRAAPAGQAAEKVTVTVTETYTIAAAQAPPEDVFRFTPPEGAREVPNVASRRNSK